MPKFYDYDTIRRGGREYYALRANARPLSTGRVRVYPVDVLGKRVRYVRVTDAPEGRRFARFDDIDKAMMSGVDWASAREDDR